MFSAQKYPNAYPLKQILTLMNFVDILHSHLELQRDIINLSNYDSKKEYSQIILQC